MASDIRRIQDNETQLERQAIQIESLESEIKKQKEDIKLMEKKLHKVWMEK
jgi:uncharacterized coiled-coil protein SlyX